MIIENESLDNTFVKTKPVQFSKPFHPTKSVNSFKSTDPVKPINLKPKNITQDNPALKPSLKAKPQKLAKIIQNGY